MVREIRFNGKKDLPGDRVLGLKMRWPFSTFQRTRPSVPGGFSDTRGEERRILGEGDAHDKGVSGEGVFVIVPFTREKYAPRRVFDSSMKGGRTLFSFFVFFFFFLINKTKKVL